MAGKKQFDMDKALDAAMIQFWREGYADTSLDDLSRATGLNRSSLYSSFGDKDRLFLRCLDLYATRYGEKYEAALASAASDPVAAVRAFFDVTLERIADPELPDGCLIAQSAMAIPVLSPGVAAHAEQALDLQYSRLRTALKAGRLSDHDAETFAVHAAAVNQSLAVMSRAGASPAQLRSIVGVTIDALSQALRG
ncbi:TetR/AcrR family transcriptional regulator [Streptomyces albus]|uniref:TetR/AcrR family transcriptional regulator n=1 Tax=Streptomyces albus TaxID=1888 RepID=A0A6C1C269_9ACTN|nr:TetR/AcrR family transcriptional regulator [Streptomyces albus]MDI6407984.1 TetR/AcrR family transcriptional regulator [Streptomyces albus]QID36260.1 TetR/AcrR family transcriptional regulator [Streptomyces albus]TGG83338.1 TetR/AcrR family transcriptional regulator [Streptomyces albus]UVN56910.1 TetR/AcrR family transcriptional regulator [Streptomyces albus]